LQEVLVTGLVWS